MQSCQTDKCPDILYTYDYVQQTNWNDDTCDIKGNSKEDRGFFLMNHWMNNDASLPSPTNAAEFNTYESLRKRYERCDGGGGDGKMVPNIIAVDFWDVGDVLDFVRDVNERNVSGGVRCCCWWWVDSGVMTVSEARAWMEMVIRNLGTIENCVGMKTSTYFTGCV